MNRKIFQTVAFLMAVCLVTAALSGCSLLLAGETAVNKLDSAKDELNALQSEVGQSVSSVISQVQEQQKKLTLGTVDGDRWENEYLGIGCQLKGYTFFSQEEIKDLNQLTADLVDNEAYTKALESAQVVQSMYAHKNSQLDTVNVVMEKVTVASASYSAQEYAQAGKKATEQAMSNLLEDVSVTVGTVTFLGEQHPAVIITGSVNGMRLVQKQAVLRRGSYFCAVTASSYTGENPDDILAKFYAVD